MCFPRFVFMDLGTSSPWQLHWQSRSITCSKPFGPRNAAPYLASQKIRFSGRELSRPETPSDTLLHLRATNSQRQATSDGFMEKYRRPVKETHIWDNTFLPHGSMDSTCACSIDLPNDHAPRWYVARPPAKALRLSRFSTCPQGAFWERRGYLKNIRFWGGAKKHAIRWADNFSQKLKVPFWGITFWRFLLVLICSLDFLETHLKLYPKNCSVYLDVRLYFE